MNQASLFELPERDDPIYAGPCSTCGATRPDDYDRHLFLEPVSGECHECNGRTLVEMMRPVSPEQRAEAIQRHLREHLHVQRDRRRRKRRHT